MNKAYTSDEYIEIINAALEKEMPVCDYNEPVVCDAMKYSVRNGGKRIRPMLTLEFCRLCHGEIEDAVPLACAIEMIHTYSLIHDDLPCMDDDDMRRGKPSCHIKYGENYALLAGDGLLTYAFQVISKSSFAATYPARAIKAIEVLSSLSGCCGMIGGQVIDLKSEGKNVGIETLRKMDELKTGALIKAAAVLGVIAAGGNDVMMKAAEAYAEKVGQAFQIVDDILDVTSDEETLGKPVGSDAENNKSTYVTLLGLEESKKLSDKLTAEAKADLAVFGDDAEFLKELADKLALRKH
ncbi:MAG: polyprenyl synthetase family protein [Faecalibacterium sp.]|nr:polyprenyl synthetase family protein [Ruminococcus sp.]MCM1392723.1 polyprenyl synthetase family protein [Ruminococcus sp.]MCM1485193.1 polyprenyl synthetase family protein [Faecalibacterium sp.]